MPMDRIRTQLWNIIHGRREVVDGVEIDLRHELLPRRDWRPNLSLTFGTTSEPPWQAPFIWFPVVWPLRRKRCQATSAGRNRRTGENAGFRTRGGTGER